MGEELLTAREFARTFGYNERTMQTLAKRGLVEECQHRSAGYLAPVRAWQKAAALERKPGRPRTIRQAPPSE